MCIDGKRDTAYALWRRRGAIIDYAQFPSVFCKRYRCKPTSVYCTLIIYSEKCSNFQYMILLDFITAITFLVIHVECSRNNFKWIFSEHSNSNNQHRTVCSFHFPKNIQRGHFQIIYWTFLEQLVASPVYAASLRALWIMYKCIHHDIMQ